MPRESTTGVDLTTTLFDQGNIHSPHIRGSEVICVGESMVLLVPVAGSLASAPSAEIRVADAESNTAQYLADLGHTVSWVSRVGSDPLGDRILEEVAGSSVDVSHVHRDPAAPTAVYFKDPAAERTRDYYYRTNSAASRLTPSDLDGVNTNNMQLAHTTGITLALSESCARTVTALFEIAVSRNAIRSFDVNFRPALWSVEQARMPLLEAARRADVVFVGLDEAHTLWGVSTPSEVRTLVGGHNELVVKNAEVGATIFNSVGEVFVPAFQVDVVEPVGAGDAFAAGYLSGLLRNASGEERLLSGHRAAALALGIFGDHADATPLRRTTGNTVDLGWTQ